MRDIRLKPKSGGKVYDYHCRIRHTIKRYSTRVGAAVFAGFWTRYTLYFVLVMALISTLSASIFAIAQVARGVPPPVLTIEDLTPKFLAFYKEASKEHVDEARRWELWQQLYAFAAVPPTPEGQLMARKILDDAWERYKAALPAIERGNANLQPPPSEILQSVADLLKVDVPIRAKLLLFVGGFDNNAFTAPGGDGIPTVALPVEGIGSALLLIHEFTHVAEAEEAHLSLGWQRSIAHTIFAEGLAMRVTQNIHPGLPDRAYVGEFTPDWFARAQAKQSLILADIAPHIAESNSSAVMRFTMGTGGAGLEREAYYTGWIVIGDLLQHGWTYSRLARVTDDQMPRIVSDSLARVQKRHPSF
jgi:hypothetical protein